jgi:hypothetical protein
LRKYWISWHYLIFTAVKPGQKRARWPQNLPDGPEEYRSVGGELGLVFGAPRAARDIEQASSAFAMASMVCGVSSASMLQI